MTRTKRFSEMTPKLFSRSGISVGCFAQAIGWKADVLVQVGVGMHHEEIDIISGVWKLPRENVLAFEANPKLFHQIQKDFPGQLFNIAVSDSRGEVEIYNKIKHADGSSLYPYKREDERVEVCKVQSDTMDNMMKFIQFKADCKVLYWVDVEGHELNVLRGSESFIEHVDLINIEMTMNPPGHGWCDSVEVHDWLEDHGFLPQWIHTHRIGDGQCDYIYIKSHLFRPDFCCIPQMIKEWRRCHPKTT